jgi:DNA-binding MarR family transcriptional regulator
MIVSGAATVALVSPARTARSTVTPRVSYVVGRLDRALRREIAALVAPHGLTVPQYTALSILRDRAGLSNAQLARRSYVTPQSINEVIAALERDDLVARSPAANHGRVLEMTLTDKGHAVLARCEAAVTEMESRMLADLDPDERVRLLTALKHCVHRLGAGLPDP